MMLYAAVISGWVMVSGSLVPFSATVSPVNMTHTVFAQPYEKCEETRQWAVESTEKAGIYFGVESKCVPRSIPEKPSIPTIDPTDPVG